MRSKELCDITYRPRCFLSVVKPVRVEDRSTWCVRETTEMRAGLWWGNLKEGDYLEGLRVDWRIILKCIFFSEMGWDGLVWIARFRLGTGGGLL